MLKLLKYLNKKDILRIIAMTVLIVVQVWLDLTMPDYTQKLSSMSESELTMHAVWINGGKMIICALLSMSAAIVCGFLASRIAASLAYNLRHALFDKVLNFSSKEINNFSTPSLITRTTNDVVQMQMFISMGLMALIKAPTLAIWALIKISSTSVEWTYATLITIGVIVVVLSILILFCYPKFKRVQKLTDSLNGITRENISGVRVIRAFNAEEYQSQKFENINETLTNNQLFTGRAMGMLMPLLTVCMNGLTLAIFWIGAYLINDANQAQKIELFGNMFAFMQYALQVVMAFMLLIIIVIMMPRAIVSGNRINKVLSKKESIIDGDINNSKSIERLEFKDVCFSYPLNNNGNDKESEFENIDYCIKNINFSVTRGETLAIIGATGCGKTTLINLIPRFYDVTKGEILLDNINIKNYTQKALHEKISIAPQKAVLFQGDIKHNVSYGFKDVDEEKIKESLKIACANFALEKGIDSEVSQGGTNFSGGQKQRLSIARAVYKKRDIIIFDDTFSALDYKTDLMVRKQIKENLNDSIIIIVAQRIGTIKNADKIIVLDEGEIVGIGKHKELLDNCKVYKDIALSQLSKEEL